jgi:5-formaminoimidazole-4-carboxamide-1-beta-D-ribofuranosyl 5'-monophosphate synthetase
VNAYFQYFHSLLQGEVELLGMDKRYESTIDSIGGYLPLNISSST